MRDTAENPYDFRSPVRSLDLLAGRSDELEKIDQLMRTAASGRPTCLSIFGEAGYGKSSLLNGAAAIAHARGLLPIQMRLRSAVTATELTFYVEVFDVALQTLVTTGQLEAGGELMHQWLRQTRLGEAALSSEIPAFEVGLLASAALSGKLVAEVPIPALQRDLTLLLSLSHGTTQRGVALCIDDGEYLDNNRDLAQSLSALAAIDPRLTLITATAVAGTLHNVAPRAWDQIEVKPLVGASVIFEAMTKPLTLARESALTPTIATASDVEALTRGQPFEVNLVCHFIWEAVRNGEQSGFELSPAVIERVLGELEERGRSESSSAIALLSELSSAEYDVLARVAPYESLTVHQLALVQLMLRDFAEEELAEAEAAVRADLQALDERGVLTIEADRFAFRGGEDARLYAKYALRARGAARMRRSRSYSQEAAFTCGDKLGEALVGQQYSEALILGSGVPHEMGGVQAGSWLRGLFDAAGEAALPALAELLPFPWDISRYRPFKESGLMLCGLVLQIGVDEFEHLELLANAAGLSAAELERTADAWLESNRGLLGKYSVSVLELRVHLLSPEVSRNLIAYSQLQVMGQVAFVLYASGLVHEAREALAEVVTELERLLGEELREPLVRTQFADAYSRLSFMAATLRDFEAAESLHDQSEQLAIDSHWLRYFNAAYVAARRGQTQEAVRLGRLAADQAVDGADLMVLHADFGEPDDFPRGQDPRWNVVRLNGSWIKRFVELQVAIWIAKTNGESDDLTRAVSTLGSSTPAELLRLAAWGALQAGARRDLAEELFARAIEASDLERVEGLKSEAAAALALGA